MGVAGELINSSDIAFTRFNEILKNENIEIFFIDENLIKGYEKEYRLIKNDGEIILFILPSEEYNFLEIISNQVESSLGMKVEHGK